MPDDANDRKQPFAEQPRVSPPPVPPSAVQIADKFPSSLAWDVLESLPFELFVLGPEGRYLLQSALCRQHWGDVVGKRPEETCSDPHTLSIWQENNRRAFAGERVDRRVHYQVQGEERCLHNILVPVGPLGNVRAIVGLNVDITEQVRAEAALQQTHEELEQRVQDRTVELDQTNQQLRREIEERRRAEQNRANFARLAEAAGQGFALGDLQGRLTYVNPKLCQMLGYRAEEMLGEPCTSYYPENYQAQLQNEIIPAVQTEGNWVGEAPLVTRTGTVLTVLQNLFLLRDDGGDPVQVANVLSDISERKAAEESLRQSHEQLQAIYDGMLDGLLLVDIETTRFVGANASMHRLLRCTGQELLQMTVCDIHPPEDVAGELEHFRAAAEGQVSKLGCRRVLRKDGTVFFAELRASRILYQGRSTMIGMFRDISERIAAEQALAQERQVLQNLLAAGDRERQLISYEIHDGLTQQITGALMQFQTCAAFYSKDLSKAAKAYQRGVHLLQASLAEARRLISGVRPPLLDDAGVVAAIENLVRETNCQNGPHIEFFDEFHSGRLQPVLENAIYRIIQECLTNACHHSQSDRVHIELRDAPGSVEIRVQDWGVGFLPETIPSICFGLAGIRERTRLLGGKVTLESLPGRGTCVRIRLPLILRSPQESET